MSIWTFEFSPGVNCKVEERNSSCGLGTKHERDGLLCHALSWPQHGIRQGPHENWWQVCAKRRRASHIDWLILCLGCSTDTVHCLQSPSRNTSLSLLFKMPVCVWWAHSGPGMRHLLQLGLFSVLYSKDKYAPTFAVHQVKSYLNLPVNYFFLNHRNITRHVQTPCFLFKIPFCLRGAWKSPLCISLLVTSHISISESNVVCSFFHLFKNSWALLVDLN